MAAWTFKGESGKSFVDTPVTLESQGVSSATVSFRSLEADILTLEYQVADYAASSTLPELRQTISLYRDSTRFFYGNVIRVSPKVDATSSTVIVEVAGPWWWLDRIPMTSTQVDGEGNSATRPMYVFGTFTDGADMKTNLEAAIDRAITLGAPLIRGTVSSSFTVPRITLSQSTCGDVISELVRLIPDSMLWFDYSGTGYATINISRRADGSTPTRTVALGTDDVTALNIQPLIELEVSEVKIPYVSRATTGETQYTTQDSGTASTGKVEILPASGPELVDFLPNDQLDTIKIANAYDGNDSGLLSAVKDVIYPGWADVVASVAGAEGVNYGLDVTDTFINSASGSIVVNRNFNSGVSGSSTESYPVGTTNFSQTSIPSGKKFLVFENGQEPPQWAIDDYSLTEYYPAVISWFDQNLSGSTYVEERRFAIMDATRWSLSQTSVVNTGIDNNPAAGTTGAFMFAMWFPDKECKIWLCDTAKIPANNTLIRGADFTFAAPPANFAANLLAAQNYVPHEGSIDLTSSDAGATRYRGTKVRVTGSLSTMTAMDAPVSGETLDIREGSTQVELGQPPRLSFLEFVNRVRRTPQDNTDYITEEPNWNASAKAYFDKCEDTDSFTWSLTQKSAIHMFFNKLLTMGDSSTDMTSDIKALHFYGANNAVCLRNAMSPATVYASWVVAPSGGDIANGALDTDGLDGGFNRTQSELGLATKQQGGFIAVTDVPDLGSGAQWWMNAYSTSTKNFQLKVDTGELAGRWSFSSVCKGQSELRNGIFVSSRQNNAVTCINKTNSAGRQKTTNTRTQNAGLSTNDISMILGSGSYNVQSKLSVMGITYGLSETECERLADALYDLAIGVGHTAIGLT